MCCGAGCVLTTLAECSRWTPSWPQFDALEPLEEVAAALVFGSHALGRARASSDIDVGVLLRDPISSDRKSEIRALIEALAGEIASDRIDLVVLNDAPPVLAFRALKHGKVAFVREPVTLHRFRVRSYSCHADYEAIER